MCLKSHRWSALGTKWWPFNNRREQKTNTKTQREGASSIFLFWSENKKTKNKKACSQDLKINGLVPAPPWAFHSHPSPQTHLVVRVGHASLVCIGILWLTGDICPDFREDTSFCSKIAKACRLPQSQILKVVLNQVLFFNILVFVLWAINGNKN